MGMSKEQTRALFSIVNRTNLDFSELATLVMISKVMGYTELYLKGKEFMETFESFEDKLWTWRDKLLTQMEEDPGD